MRMREIGRGAWNLIKQYGLTAALFLAMTLITVGAMTGASRASTDQQLRQAEQAVRRAAVNCYASEGFYPESYDYLKENYAVRVDETKFQVIYAVYGSNLMPEVAVVEVAQ